VAERRADRDGKDEAGDVALTIKRFTPNDVPPEVWAVIGPLARKAATIAAGDDPEEARDLLGRTAALLSWCSNEGVDLAFEVSLAPETIDRYIVQACSHLADGTRLNYRRLLSHVGRAVLGPPLYPERRVALQKSPTVAPYTADQVRRLAGWARGLPTARMRDGAAVVLGLGFGAGLRSIEIARATASWVETTPAGPNVVVHGAHARRIPVRRDWEWAIAQAVAASDGSFLLLPGRAIAHRKDVSVFVENLPRHDAPKLSPQRMRGTWIVEHWRAGVPPTAIATAAGISPEQLFNYTAWLPALDPGETDRLLRGSAP
jgi:hypothetical protein